MKTICLLFQVHQPLRHRRYRFFDIGNDHYYYDDYTNETTIKNLSEKCYLPTNDLLFKLAKSLKGKLKIAFSITGVALEQFEIYAPEVIRSFKKLNKTGCVEFLSETWSHSLSSLGDKPAFVNQVKMHEQRISELFGQKPSVFRNTEMIYSDEIGAHIHKMGYKGIVTEGPRHILGWKSPNFVYVNALNPRLKVLMRNFKLSDDISFRFSNKDWSEYPLTAEKFIGWIKSLNPREEVVNLFLNYETFGGIQPAKSGIFDFLKYFIEDVASDNELKFSFPSEIIREIQPVSAVNVPYPISWADEERDLTAWLGNDMQKEAYGKLYSLCERMKLCTNDKLLKDWNYLQVSDHFYYMCTKMFSNGEVHSYFNPFESPYEAFINFMNVLSDFKIRLNSVVPGNKVEQEIAAIHQLIDEKEKKIKKMEAELNALQRPAKAGKTVRIRK